MRHHRARESIKIVAAFEHRDEPTFAVIGGGLFYELGQFGKVVIGQGEPRTLTFPSHLAES